MLKSILNGSFELLRKKKPVKIWYEEECDNIFALLNHLKSIERAKKLLKGILRLVF